jgi:orotate phosphoribosyltransferase
MKNVETAVARQLLQIKAIKLEPAKPFLWASGWYSPIYCDNRLILSYPETRVVVIEDLVSTGKSSLSAVEALRTEGCNVMGMAAIFSYGFETAADNFRMASCELHSLTNYEILIDVAIDKGFVSHEHIKTLRDWRNNPEEWGKL